MNNYENTILPCAQGKHQLEEIYNIDWGSQEDSVKWCRVCGCVIIDVEYDGRLWQKGGVMSMKAPLVTRQINDSMLREASVG